MPYRDFGDAIESRRVALRAELAELKDRVTGLPYLAWRQKEIAGELTALRIQQSQQTRTRLPMLAKIKIASPCSVSWETMAGDDRVRSCGSCQKNIYDFSAMTAAEVEALLLEKEGRLCARFYRRTDGTILVGSDCGVGARAKLLKRAATGVVLITGLSALAGIGIKKFGWGASVTYDGTPTIGILVPD